MGLCIWSNLRARAQNLLRKFSGSINSKRRRIPANVTRRRFLCNVKIKPEQAKDLQIFSLGGPSDVISVKSLAKGSGNQFQEAVVIDRVEYADGSFWQTEGLDL